MTILILFDRLNYSVFKAKHCKLTHERLHDTNHLHHTHSHPNHAHDHDTDQKSKTVFFNNTEANWNDTSSQASEQTFSDNTLPDFHAGEKVDSHFFDISQIMSQNMALENFHPYKGNEFGSFHYMIRSKRPELLDKLKSQHHMQHSHNHPHKAEYVSEDEDEFFGKETTKNKSAAKPADIKSASYYFGHTKTKKVNVSPVVPKLNTGADTLLTSNSQISAREKHFYKTYQMPKLNHDIYQNSNPFMSSSQENSLNQQGFSETLTTFNNRMGAPNKLNSQSYNNFVYNKVSSDIYSNFGRAKPNNGYPQQLKSNRTTSSIQKAATNLLRPHESVLDVKNQLNLASKDFFLPKIF